jgi:hypothetical protein
VVRPTCGLGQANKEFRRQIDKSVIECAYEKRCYLGRGTQTAEMVLNEELFRVEAEAEVCSTKDVGTTVGGVWIQVGVGHTVA